MKLTFILLCALTASFSVYSQSEEEKLYQIEVQKAAAHQRILSLQMDSAILLSDQGKYVESEEKFKLVLKNLKSIPSDFTFHFGKNSFYLGKYKQSIDWLNKYLQLKGTAGQYSEEAANLLTKSEAELLKERELQSRQAGELLSRDYDIDCGPSGKIVCPVCSGTHVIVRKSYLRETYSTCNYCDDHGNLSCVDYNKLIRGQLKPLSN